MLVYAFATFVINMYNCAKIPKIDYICTINLQIYLFSLEIISASDITTYALVLERK